MSPQPRVNRSRTRPNSVYLTTPPDSQPHSSSLTYLSRYNPKSQFLLLPTRSSVTSTILLLPLLSLPLLLLYRYYYLQLLPTTTYYYYYYYYYHYYYYHYYSTTTTTSTTIFYCDQLLVLHRYSDATPSRLLGREIQHPKMLFVSRKPILSTPRRITLRLETKRRRRRLRLHLRRRSKSASGRAKRPTKTRICARVHSERCTIELRLYTGRQHASLVGRCETAPSGSTRLFVISRRLVGSSNPGSRGSRAATKIVLSLTPASSSVEANFARENAADARSPEEADDDVERGRVVRPVSKRSPLSGSQRLGGRTPGNGLANGTGNGKRKAKRAPDATRRREIRDRRREI